jgi:hypothetical protein
MAWSGGTTDIVRARSTSGMLNTASKSSHGLGETAMDFQPDQQEQNGVQ